MQLGEAALYRPSDRTLHYLDIERKPVSALYIAQLDAAGALVAAPKMLQVQGSRYVTALAFLRSDESKYLCTTHTGLAYLDSETGSLSHLPNGLGDIVSSEQEGEKMRFNDAVADSHGRFYFHSMSKDESRKSGKLYLYDPRTMKGKSDLKVLEENFAIGNGPTIDEERRKFYFNVTSEGIGYVYDYDPETGLISNRRDFFNNHKRRPASLTDPLSAMVGPGFPDGHTLDSRGRVYQAVFARGLIERFTPDGECDLQIETGARCPTSCVFGGDSLRTLLVTTASEALQPGEIQVGGDRGGNILRIDLDDVLEEGVKGVVKPSFDG